MTIVVWTLVIAAVLLGWLATRELGRSFGRPFFRRAIQVGGMALSALCLLLLWTASLGGPASALLLAAAGFTLAVVVTAVTRYAGTD